MSALAWMADQVAGPALLPSAGAWPRRAAFKAPTKRSLMLDAIAGAGSEGMTSAELGRLAGCASRRTHYLLARDLECGAVKVKRTFGGRFRWFIGDAPTPEIGRAINLLESFGYTVTR